jgi:L-threonylcarbamoyladenylate synthase
VPNLQPELPKKVQKQIEKGIEIIRHGGVVAFPTDTVYGVGAGAYIESAIQRVYEVKRRPREMPLPLLLADAAQIHEVASRFPAYAWRLVERFLPGGLTLVVFRTPIVKDIITSGGTTVAIRIPDHPVPVALIKGSGMPIVGTSANLSGMPNANTVSEVKNQIGDMVDLVLEGGPIPGGKESTVVDVTGELPVILRVGAISRAELQKVVKMG